MLLIQSSRYKNDANAMENSDARALMQRNAKRVESQLLKNYLFNIETIQPNNYQSVKRIRWNIWNSAVEQSAY